jgi:hypothetical protein
LVQTWKKVVVSYRGPKQTHPGRAKRNTRQPGDSVYEEKEGDLGSRKGNEKHGRPEKIRNKKKGPADLAADHKEAVGNARCDEALLSLS